jgi:hypothetical protein
MMASLATGWRGAGQTRAAQRKEGEGLLARASARGINVVDWEATPPAFVRSYCARPWTATVPLDTLAAVSGAGFVPIVAGSRTRSSHTI